MRGEERFVFDLSRIAGFSTRLLITACTTTDKDRRHLSRQPARKFLTTPPFLRLFRSFHHRPLLEEFTRKGEESFVLNDLIIFHESFFGYSSFSPPRRYFTRFSSTIFRVYIHDTLLRRIFFQPTELKRTANCFHL